MKYTLIIGAFISILLSCNTKSKIITNPSLSTNSVVDATKIPYKTFKNDPTGLRLYTLENGLKVYLSKNTDEPKIETLIAVKAGSTYDPANQTGLAHYLEHMLFKGTQHIGTLNWEKEKVVLNTISDLYETHRLEPDLEKKKGIYRQIDSVSGIAATYAIANEYDKMISSIGAEGTNAFTSNEMTVYKNKIPVNELDKWLLVEGERFSELVLRLFHTELEAVYEEFNRGQDSDGRKQYQSLLGGLFPTHPYGTQTTIGTSEHLKNPSMKAIHEYFNTYYVPNNMAVILVGDLDFDETIAKVNKTFGGYKAKPVTHATFPDEKPITAVIEKKVYGPSAESVYVGFRTPKVTEDSTIMITLIDYLLANSSAGLIDLNLNSLQKVQSASSYTNFQKDYGMHILYGVPRQGQSLDDVKKLLLDQLEHIKKGEFDDWLIEAIVNDMTLSQIKNYERASAVAFEYMYSFVYEQAWEQRLGKLEAMRKITKQQVMDFATEFYKDNYVVVKKEVGEDPNLVKVENPKITPITVNRDAVSSFVKNFNTLNTLPIKPQVIDYNSQIKTIDNTSNVSFSYINNETNDFASLAMIYPVGADHNKYLGLAASYIDYLGTNEKSNEAIKKEFYKLGIEYSINVTKEETYISISGLQQNIPEGLKLILAYLQDLKVDAEAYKNLIIGEEKQRLDMKKEKRNILWSGLMNYSKYNEDSRLRNIETIANLKKYNPEQLIPMIQELLYVSPKFFYFGKEAESIKKQLVNTYPLAKTKENTLLAKTYTEKENIGKVYFVNYDMVQAELVFISKATQYDPKLTAKSMLFNNYFGSGLSSIVFQELRESKSLAYSAMAKYAIASEKELPNYLFSYIGTQANKLPEAVEAMKELLQDMPLNEAQFEAAKESVLKTIASNRINKANVYWNFQKLKKLGIVNDNRAEIYNAVKAMSLADLNVFFKTHIKDQKFDLLVIGNKKDLDLEALKKHGELEELEVDYLFNY